MQIDAYTVTRELGRGGMGVVYEVRHPDWPDAPLALKLILGEHADATTTARFQREAEVLARIDHPNVVRVRTLGLYQEQLYLVTDMVPGESLSEVLRRGALSPEEATRVVCALAEALEAAHAQGVLHRDLKPANVILRPDGSPVLLDFGVALDQSAEKLTQTGAMIGTPAYMSPEQAAGERSRMGPASDVYSLGAILFALLSGRAPFEGASSMVLVKMVLTDEPRWPSSDDARVPASLEAVLRKAMMKEPHQRYRSAGAFAEDLARWGRGEQPLAYTTFQAEQRRGRLPLVVGALLAVALVVVVVVGAQTPVPTPTPSAIPTSSTPAPPARDPADELRRLETSGGKQKIERARAFLSGFPEHAAAARVRRELLVEGLQFPVRVGEVGRALQPWGRLLDPNRLVFLSREYVGREDYPVMLWDLDAGRGRGVGPLLSRTERTRHMAAAIHLDRLALPLPGSGLLRVDPTAKAPRGNDLAAGRAKVTALAAHGEWLAAGFADGGVSVWRGGALQAGPGIAGHGDLPDPGCAVHGLGFTSDGARLVSSSGENRSVRRVWSLSDGARLREDEIERDEIHVVLPVPHRPELVLIGTHDTYHLDLVDVATGKVARRFLGSDLRSLSKSCAHSSHLRDAVFSPDGTRLYSVSSLAGIASSSELRVWDVATGKELVPPIRRPEQVFWSVTLDPSGATAVTLSQREGDHAVSWIDRWQVDRPEPSK